MKPLSKAGTSWIVVTVIALAAGLVSLPPASVTADEKSKKSETTAQDASVNRTRKTVHMLDDLYKTAIVLITKNYVEDESSTPAASAAVALWETMEKKGWHKVRLVDATGDPYDVDNVPKTDFEKRAIKKLNAKNAYFDQVVTEDGKRYLEAVTYVPVVMDKCVLCHPNYADVPKGATIGAVSYRLPIEE